MAITTDQLTIGHAYERPQLAEMWGYTSWEAISRGVITPAGQKVIVLFITHEKQEALTQYQDTFDGQELRHERLSRSRLQIGHRLPA
jgi:putative restriction endonuclease